MLLLFLTSCVSANVTQYPNAHYGPNNPENVAVYNNFPPMEYEVIGEVEGNGAPAATWGRVSGVMRKKAAMIGGDAVIIQVQDRPFIGTINEPGRIRGNSYGTMNAYGMGNSVYGNYSGTSNYTVTPATSTPMYGKYQRGVVIKFINSSEKKELEADDSAEALHPNEKLPASNTEVPTNAQTDTVAQLEKLAKLKTDGVLTEEEFKREKKKLLE